MPKKLKPPHEEVIQKYSLFSRGYDDVHRRMSKNPKFIMSCYNCEYYYQASGDKEEVCQNPEVLKYDMVITDTTIYCSRWEPCGREQSVKSLFKKGGTK